jgi:hypothetical protein
VTCVELQRRVHTTEYFLLLTMISHVCWNDDDNACAAQHTV